MAIKKVQSYFSSKTSNLAKKIGDTILVGGTTIIGFSDMTQEQMKWGMGAIVLGKMITNFFTDPTFVTETETTDAV